MRITNKIMQNNSLSNINLAKVAEDIRSNQVTSGKKIVRPSDDPIVAIRSLRLRSSVTELTQYYARNAKDADAWLKTTEDAIQQVSDVLTDMITQYNKGANEYLTNSNRDIILEQLKSLQKEVYATGDADYAGRYVFTGYRTESSLMFREDTDKVTYRITEQLTASDLKTNTFVNTSYEAGVNADGTKNYLDLTNIQAGTQADYSELEEKLIDEADYHRIRLSYKDCKEAIPTIQYKNKDGKTVTIGETGKSIDGAAATPPGITMAKSTDVPSPYMEIGKTGNEDKIIYLSDTGELLLGNNIYKELSDLKDDPHTNNENEGEIRVTYEKAKFRAGDLRPEHYFYSQVTKEDGTTVEYNPNYLTYGKERQVIEYDVGFNQRLQVNTIAEECFNPAVVREVDDMIQALEKMKKIEEVTNTLKDMMDKEIDQDKKKILQNQIDAANKAYTYERKVTQDKFSKGIKVMQGFQDEVNVAVTSCGARGSRLELVSSRLSSQKSTFETLQSENEDVDLSEAVVQLTSAEMTYEAALKATGKIMQVNLMDFI